MLNDITPKQLSLAYDFIRSMPPFTRYKIPPSECVEFRIVNDPRVYAWHKLQENGTHIIAVSRNCIGHTDTLLCKLSHELIHLIQAEKGTHTRTMHNAEFVRIANKVCKIHGFDFKAFI